MFGQCALQSIFKLSAGSELEAVTLVRPEVLQRYIKMGRIAELQDMLITEEKQNGLDIFASRANLDIKTTFLYIADERTPLPVTPDPTAGTSLPQLEINR